MPARSSTVLVALALGAANLLLGLAIGSFLAGSFAAVAAAAVLQAALSIGFFAAGIKINERPLAALRARLERVRSGEAELEPYAGDMGRGAVPALSDSAFGILDRFRKNLVATRNIWRKDYELSQDLLSSSNAILEGIRTISASSASLERTAGDLDLKIAESKRVVEGIRSSLDEAKKVFQDQSSAVEQSSASVEELISSIQNIAKISETKKAVLVRLVESASRGKTQVDQALGAISAIEETTKLMMDLVGVIGEISDKSSLLSMNASIEAAHAGIHGKGFAVVAAEIKKLAESSRRATDTISASLKDISSKIGKTVRDSSALRADLGEILTSVQETASSMEEILNGMAEMSQGTDQISSALSLMVDAALDAKRHTECVLAGAANLQASLADIEGGSRSNYSASRSIAEGVRQIDDSMLLLSKVSDDNSKDLANMKRLLDQTKTKKRFICDYIPPMQYIETDRITGAFAEIVGLICGETGEEPSIEFMAWDEALALVPKAPGVYVMSILRTAQREGKFRWIGPVVPDQHYLYRLKERQDVAVGSVEDLRRYRVGCVETNYAFKYFLDNGIPAANILASKIHMMAMLNLLQGKVDLIPLGMLQVAYMLRSMNRPLDLLERTIPITGFSTDSYLATSLSTPDEDFEAHERAFAAVRETEAYRAILRKYRGG